MHYLYDQEIKDLAKMAEMFILNQRTKLKSPIVIEDPRTIAVELLKRTVHLDGDIDRLYIAIKRNLQNMDDWFNKH